MDIAALAAKVEAEPARPRNWDRLRADLEEALESDETFRAELTRRLAAAGSIQQTAAGDHNQQVAVTGSSNVSIHINKPF